MHNRMRMKKNILINTVAGLYCLIAACSDTTKDTNPPAPPPVSGTQIEAWFTKADQTALLQKQLTNLVFSSPTNNLTNLEIDSASALQSVDGFGYSLTGGSAYLINRMSQAQKSALLNELFGNGDNSIRVSYLRVSIGASDLSPEVFSYNDLPAGQLQGEKCRWPGDQSKLYRLSHAKANIPIDHCFVARFRNSHGSLNAYTSDSNISW